MAFHSTKPKRNVMIISQPNILSSSSLFKNKINVKLNTNARTIINNKKVPSITTSPLLKDILYINHQCSRNESAKLVNHNYNSNIMSMDSVLNKMKSNKNIRASTNELNGTFTMIKNRRSTEITNQSLIKEMELILKSKKKKLKIAKTHYMMIKEEYESMEKKSYMNINEINELNKNIEMMQNSNLNLSKLIRENNQLHSDLILLEGNDINYFNTIYNVRCNKSDLNYSKKANENKEAIFQLITFINTLSKEFNEYKEKHINKDNNSNEPKEEINTISKVIKEIDGYLHGNPEEILKTFETPKNAILNKYTYTNSGKLHFQSNQMTKSALSIKSKNKQFILKQTTLQKKDKILSMNLSQSLNELSKKRADSILNRSIESLFRKEKEELQTINTNLINKIANIQQKHEEKVNEITGIIKEITNKVFILHKANVLLKKEIELLSKSN